MSALTECLPVNDERSTKLLWAVWRSHPNFKLDGDNNFLVGYSWAALRTNFVVSRLVFDAGLSYPGSSDYIFLTHGHSDHSASLYFHTLGQIAEGKKRTIFLPEEIKPQIDALLRITFEVSNPGIPWDAESARFQTVGVRTYTEEGERTFFDIEHNGKPHRAFVYENDHSVPCRSFGFKELQKKLKPEYESFVKAGRGKELGELRKGGVVIENITWVPRFCYIGDTTERVFELNPEIFEYKSIIIECTFLLDEDLEQAALTKHCHWRTLRPIIEEHPETTFVLYHFSMRYKPEQIAEFFRVGGGNDLPNIHPWTHE